MFIKSINTMLNDYNLECGYRNTQLQDYVYLATSAITRDINLESANNDYSVSVSGGGVIKVIAHNVSVVEEVDYSGRYEFHRTVEFTVEGYVNNFGLGNRKYIIVENKEGVQFMVNTDFESEISYNFTLDTNNYNTTFRYEVFSNMPMLKLSKNVSGNTFYSNGCRYMVPEIESVKLSYFRDVKLTDDDELEIVQPLKDIDFIDASLTETYSDREYVQELTLTIPMDGRSWHYQLLEFKDNLYFALVKPKGSSYHCFLGLEFGLQCNYELQNSEDNGSIQITFRHRGNGVMDELDDFYIINTTDTQWIDDKRFQECVSDNTAIYTLKKQVDKFGNPTNLYKAYIGHTEYFESLGFNIIGEFTLGEATEFESQRCSKPPCTISTTLPYEIKLYYNESSMQYQLTCDCDWSVTDVSSGFTVTPSSGASGQEYNISIRNTNQVNTSGYFAIQYGQNIQYFNLISRSQNFVQPSSGYTVDCTQHTLTFNVDYSGTPSLQFVPSYLEYTYTNGILKVKIPNNTIPYPRSWNMVVNGSGLSQIVPIEQTPRYEEWRRVDDQYVCVSGQAYTLETLFTGVTPSSLSATDVTRQGSQVSISGACATTMYRWVDSGWRVTISSVSYIVEKEQYSENGGVAWYDTGATRIGNAVT